MQRHKRYPFSEIVVATNKYWLFLEPRGKDAIISHATICQKCWLYTDFISSIGLPLRGLALCIVKQLRVYLKQFLRSPEQAATQLNLPKALLPPLWPPSADSWKFLRKDVAPRYYSLEYWTAYVIVRRGYLSQNDFILAQHVRIGLLTDSGACCAPPGQPIGHISAHYILVVGLAEVLLWNHRNPPAFCRQRSHTNSCHQWYSILWNWCA